TDPATRPCVSGRVISPVRKLQIVVRPRNSIAVATPPDCCLSPCDSIDLAVVSWRGTEYNTLCNECHLKQRITRYTSSTRCNSRHSAYCATSRCPPGRGVQQNAPDRPRRGYRAAP